MSCGFASRGSVRVTPHTVASRRMSPRVSGIVLWATLLAVPVAHAAEGDGPQRAVSALWRTMSHAPGVPVDVPALRALFHPDAVIFGSRLRDGRPSLRRSAIDTFLAAFAEPDPDGFHECEIARTIETHDRFATVTSVVETRADPAATTPDFTGINSLQLYRDDTGWKIHSLYYHVSPDAATIGHAGTSGICLD